MCCLNCSYCDTGTILPTDCFGAISCSSSSLSNLTGNNFGSTSLTDGLSGRLLSLGFTSGKIHDYPVVVLNVRVLFVRLAQLYILFHVVILFRIQRTRRTGPGKRSTLLPPFSHHKESTMSC